VERKAEEMMVKDVVSIGPDALLQEAIAKMKEYHVTSLLVERKTPSDTWGVVTQTDVVHKAIGRNIDVEGLKVTDVMTRPITTVKPTSTVGECAELMMRDGIRRVFVYEKGKIIGIISIADIFKAIPA
jgi:CBS domain-containing protein